MKKCKTILIVLIVLCGWARFSACAWAGNSPKKLLVIDTQPTVPYTIITAAMLKTLSERGFVAGQNLAVTHVSMNQREGEFNRLWQYYQGSTFDVVYVAGTVAMQALLPVLKDAPQLPVVFSSITDPVGLGLIKDFGVPPDRNITGVAYGVPVKDRIRFVRRIMPNAHTIGLIYGEIQSSVAYRAWLEKLLAQDPELKDVKVIYRSIDFIPGANGTRRMAMQAAAAIKALDPVVDVFLSPSDSMGNNPEFAHIVQLNATKPLVGIIEPDAKGGGAAVALYASLPAIGRQAGIMVARLLSGEPITAIPAERPAEIGIAIDWQLVRRFGLVIPPDIAAAAAK